MARSDTTRDIHLACAAAGRAGAREIRLQRISDRLGRCAARISTCALSITVASIVTAQNVYGQERINHLYFKLAPNLPKVEADAEAAAAATYKALAAPVVMGLLVAAGVFLYFWFTVGGGRKTKMTED